MYGGIQAICTDTENGIGTGGTVSPGFLETAGVDQHGTGVPSAERLVAVAKNDAGRIGKEGQNPLFNIVPRTGPMGYGYAVSAKHQMSAGREQLTSWSIAHIAANRVNLAVAEGGQDGNIGQIAGVDDGITLGKGEVAPALETVVEHVTVGVGKDADSLHRVISLAQRAPLYPALPGAH
jgi:hypothetical protein